MKDKKFAPNDTLGWAWEEIKETLGIDDETIRLNKEKQSRINADRLAQYQGVHGINQEPKEVSRVAASVGNGASGSWGESTDVASLRTPSVDLSVNPEQRSETVKDYILSKSEPVQKPVISSSQSSNPLDDVLKQYSDAERKKLTEENEKAASGINWAAGLAGLGAALSGKDAGGSASRVMGISDAQRKDRLAQFDSNRKQVVEEYLMRKALEDKEKEFNFKERDYNLKQEEVALKRESNNIAKDQKATKAKQTLTTNLRKEYNNDPIVKDTKNVQQAFSKIKKSATDVSAAGDLALIFNYMKMLDPGSTVREGEFANAQNSGGIPDQVRAKYNQLINGERLSTDQRKDFLKQSTNIYDAQVDQLNSVNQRYTELSDAFGVESKYVVMNPYDFSDQVNPNKEVKAKFPMQVRKDGKVATVSSEEELREARSEGWK